LTKQLEPKRIFILFSSEAFADADLKPDAKINARSPADFPVIPVFINNAPQD
jgi:hypothetical protein